MRALHESNWFVGDARGAAARLGLKRTSLSYKVQKLGIASPRKARRIFAPVGARRPASWALPATIDGAKRSSDCTCKYLKENPINLNSLVGPEGFEPSTNGL